ncbi:nucleoside hydrolase-like domain-containing protein [uncultured Draconibacterium sp.]|uniref:nucleoside hydrolase-like domain-containing protein n=1 Tax=uncultured Draconibacterium sp. TaxID=1573823 RepID=UPI00321792C4
MIIKRLTSGSCIGFVLLISLIVLCQSAMSKSDFQGKKRVVILSDFGSDSDDKQSFCRFLLYANEFDVEGLIATSATYTPFNQTGEPNPDGFISRVKAYGEVLDNLRKHADGYPSEEYLLSIIKKGTITGRKFGTELVPNGLPIEEVLGENKDTEGSKFIVELIEKNDPRPLWFCIWGGQMDLAQALWRIRHNQSEKEVQNAISRLRVCSWGFQDLGGQWIRDNFPGLFHVNSIGGILDSAEPSYLFSVNWINSNIRNNHGPLGSLYPIRTPGTGEGDTETYLGLISNGLSDMEHPDWGGWGGLMKRDLEDTAMWVDLAVPTSFKKASKKELKSVTEHSTIFRWAPEFQNDFQARMDRCVKEFEGANHNPKVIINGDSSKNPIVVFAKPGEQLKFDANASTDPDGDLMFFHWYVYNEISTIKEPKIKYGKLDNPAKEQTEEIYFKTTSDLGNVIITLPENKKGIIHLILACSDYGTPALTSYRRVIINVD